jgi:phage terminase Nu1 subunit (DNA packaging protein)
MNRKQIRWTQEHAAAEFGINPRTLSARIKQLSIEAGKDRCYSTKQIATAVYGDLERERIRLTSAEADSQERENLVELGQLIDIAEFKKDFAPIYVDMVRLIRSSPLTDPDQDALLAAISKLHLITK